MLDKRSDGRGSVGGTKVVMCSGRWGAWCTHYVASGRGDADNGHRCMWGAGHTEAHECVCDAYALVAVVL